MASANQAFNPWQCVTDEEQERGRQEHQRQEAMREAVEEAEVAIIGAQQFCEEAMAGIGLLVAAAFEAGYWAGKSGRSF